MTHEILLVCIVGLIVTGSMGLLRPADSRELNRGEETAFWIVWAVIGSWLLFVAGFFLLVPFLSIVFLHNLPQAERGEVNVPKVS